MANPELRRDSTETDWVRRLQELLEAALRNSGIQLSAVDGLFGPITEASVIYFQEQNGLHADGIVGDATWAALEAASSSSTSTPGTTTPTPGVPTTLRMRPLDLTVPWSLQIHWPETTLNQLTLDLGNFSVHSTPNTQFRFLDSGRQVVRRRRDRGLASRGAVVAELVRRLEHQGNDRLVEDRRVCRSATPINSRSGCDRCAA